MAGFVPAWIVFGALALVLVWMVCGVIAVIVLILQRQHRGHGRKQRTSQRRSRPPMATPNQMRAAVRQISIYTHHEPTAARLLHHTRLENRGKPLEWCVEKTIHDLVRDRR